MLEDGHFLKIWKQAAIVWVPKKNGAPRPISMLLRPGKALGRVINKRLLNHVEYNDSIEGRQYAYRQERGTADGRRAAARESEGNWVSYSYCNGGS